MILPTGPAEVGFETVLPVAIEARPGGFCLVVALTPEELADALQHPFREVRERALFDAAEKFTFVAADAAKKAYRREKRERGG
jgi:hypothetical protein